VSTTGNPEQIREDIEAAREELGATVEALAAKTDVRAHARRQLEQARAAPLKPALMALGALALGWLVLRPGQRS
jgi:ribosome-binding protein aMBF1 (putative translation factor)